MSTKVLVVDDKQMMRDSVGATLQRAGYAVVAAADGKAALKMVAKHEPAAVVTDLKMPEMDGLELLETLTHADPQLPVVLMTAYGSINDAVSAMKAGAFDFVQKPFEGDQLVMVVRRAVEHRRVVRDHANAGSGGGSAVVSPSLVGASAAMQAVAQQIVQIADSHGTVLIHGESGMGKEVVSRAIHAHSPRRDQVMLCLNCAALSSSLLESELFGHEKGAFTGADQLRKGRFELADGGTLLLDEISEISPQLQAKLLRVLQEGQFERVGSSKTRAVDVRVIATTNRDLSQSVADGTFRSDLYYRLNVLPIALPPLREREGDIALLAGHFLDQVAQREGREAKRFDDDALGLLAAYHWPGNVRELQNICERASVLSSDTTIGGALIQPWLLTLPTAAMTPPGAVSSMASPAGVGVMGSPPLQVAPTPAPGSVAEALPGSGVEVLPLEEVERDRILHALRRFNGNRTRAAEALGIGVRTLGLKLKKWKEQNLVAQTV
jgi:DNA-binding NtrC family response regulator